MKEAPKLTKKQIKQAMLLNIGSALRNAPHEWFTSNILSEEQQEYAWSVFEKEIDRIIGDYEGPLVGSFDEAIKRLLPEKGTTPQAP